MADMHDYIETMTLRDQANEALYFDTLAIKLSGDKSNLRKMSLESDKVEVEIDDLDHKFHFIYHSEKSNNHAVTYHPYYLYDAGGLILPG